MSRVEEVSGVGDRVFQCYGVSVIQCQGGRVSAGTVLCNGSDFRKRFYWATRSTDKPNHKTAEPLNHYKTKTLQHRNTETP